MKKMLATTLAAAFLFLAFLGVAVAGEEGQVVTVDGKMVCAMCTLKEEGLKECQNVLQVEKEGEDTINIYVAKNDVAEAFGHVCSGPKDVKVTGTVADKDGREWITASKIEELSKS